MRTIQSPKGSVFGHVQSSPDGKYWLTGFDFCTAKLWRVSDEYSLTEIACLGLHASFSLYKSCGWFAGHFLHQTINSALYITHPEALVTYVLSGCSKNFDFGHWFLTLEQENDPKDGALICSSIEFLSDEYLVEDEKFKQLVAESTGCLPVPVAGIVCRYLTHNTQTFFPKKVFEPLIPECLPQSLHQEARKLQFELWTIDF